MQRMAIVSIEWDVLDLAESLGYEVIGFFDPNAKADTAPYKVLGNDSDWDRVRKQYAGLNVALALHNSVIRRRLFQHYDPDAVVTMVSPDAYVAPGVSVGHGSIIERGATVMRRVSIGRACKIKLSVILDHDVKLGDFSTVGTGAQLSGGVTLGECAYIGAGAIIRQHCAVGAGATVGAGAVVVKDVPPGVTVVGVPANRHLS